MPGPTRTALIFLNWNTPQLTLAAVRSAQCTAPAAAALRIMIVDNGSADGSVEFLRREAPEAELLPLPENRGFARAINVALAKVTEPVAFVLNSDLEFRDGAIARLLHAFEEDPKAVLACPKLLRLDHTVQRAVVTEPRLFWELTNRSLPRHFQRVPDDRTSVVPGVVGPCMAVHMERLRPIGFLDERFFFFFEETDWCKRIRDAGMHVLYVPGAEVVHLQGESANRFPLRARVQFHQSRYTYFRKHAGHAAAAVLFAGLFLRLTMRLVIDGLLTLLTLGRRQQRDRLAIAAALWVWHLLLCRPRWGFERAGGGHTSMRTLMVLLLATGFALPLCARAAAAAAVAEETPGQQANAELTVIIPRDFKDGEVNVGVAKVDTWHLRQLLKLALADRPDTAKARVSFAQEYSNHPAINGLYAYPVSAVPLDDQGKPDGVEIFFEAHLWDVGRTVPWSHGRRQGEEFVYQKKVVTAIIPWIDDRISGIRRTFYPTGKPMSETTFVNGEANGPSRSYDAEGRLLQEVNIKSGKREGEAKDYWPETGKVRRQIIYAMSQVVGVTREFDPEGKLRREIPFKANAMHGVETVYAPDGKVSQKRYWLNGEEVSEGEFKARFRK